MVDLVDRIERLYSTATVIAVLSDRRVESRISAQRPKRMTPAQLQSELFSQLAEPFTGESLFDCLPDLVFFLKNRRGEYVVVNQTLVERCRRRSKGELIGRCADEIFPAPLGENYRAQDQSVLRHGSAILNQLELHFYASGGRGWCLTNKLPCGRNRDRFRRPDGDFHGRDPPMSAAGIIRGGQSGQHIQQLRRELRVKHRRLRWDCPATSSSSGFRAFSSSPPAN